MSYETIKLSGDLILTLRHSENINKLDDRLCQMATHGYRLVSYLTLRGHFGKSIELYGTFERDSSAATPFDQPQFDARDDHVVSVAQPGMGSRPATEASVDDHDVSRPGCVVRLNSGGPPMAVDRVSDGTDRVICRWWAGDSYKEDTFNKACLVPCLTPIESFTFS